MYIYAYMIILSFLHIYAILNKCISLIKLNLHAYLILKITKIININSNITSIEREKKKIKKNLIINIIIK